MTNEELEAQVEALEAELEELRDNYADLVKERDELQEANTRFEEKVDTARDEIEETLRGLNR
ncbi:hypothetical protein PV405_29965 [Streptomyces sp. ME02-6979-3A]|uniref:hypothetical protein n=1 Tax=Streptomyces sp. ME02-6979-3A TaxID=3028673 RepID=UPI0029B6274E|nr:hypothetical protein [Streptomyces sp. ME02-6979-3A]MDX3328839.1 hypothetical protein [Streptomyces sp. ME02-6979-3A]